MHGFDMLADVMPRLRDNMRDIVPQFSGQLPSTLWGSWIYKGNPCEMPNLAKCRIFNSYSYTQKLSLHNNHIDLYNKN